MPRVFDCFTFFNELDLLEIRLNELRDDVDHFVIVESEETFTGKPKPYVLQDNLDRFAAFRPKIIHLRMTRMADGTATWSREHAQREMLKEGLGGASGDDVVLLSDVDEIPSVEAIRTLKRTPPARGEVCCLEQRYFQFFLNLELPFTWLRTSPRAVRRDTLTTMKALRSIRPPHPQRARDALRLIKACVKMRRPVRRRVIPDAGWHFSWVGGNETVVTKAQSISPHSRLSDDYGTQAGADQMISGAIAALARRDLDHSFPRFLLANQDRYRHLILGAD